MVVGADDGVTLSQLPTLPHFLFLLPFLSLFCLHFDSFVHLRSVLLPHPLASQYVLKHVEVVALLPPLSFIMILIPSFVLVLLVLPSPLVSPLIPSFSVMQDPGKNMCKGCCSNARQSTFHLRRRYQAFTCRHQTEDS